MNTVCSWYSTIDGTNSTEGSIGVLIAPTAKDDSKVRFNIVQMVDGECKANVCALMKKEDIELFVQHLTSQCASECASDLPKCSCGETLEVL